MNYSDGVNVSFHILHECFDVLLSINKNYVTYVILKNQKQSDEGKSRQQFPTSYKSQKST